MPRPFFLVVGQGCAFGKRLASCPAWNAKGEGTQGSLARSQTDVGRAAVANVEPARAACRAPSNLEQRPGRGTDPGGPPQGGGGFALGGVLARIAGCHGETRQEPRTSAERAQARES